MAYRLRHRRTRRGSRRDGLQRRRWIAVQTNEKQFRRILISLVGPVLLFLLW